MDDQISKKNAELEKRIKVLEEILKETLRTPQVKAMLSRDFQNRLRNMGILDPLQAGSAGPLRTPH